MTKHKKSPYYWILFSLFLLFSPYEVTNDFQINPKENETSELIKKILLNIFKNVFIKLVRKKVSVNFNSEVNDLNLILRSYDMEIIEINDLPSFDHLRKINCNKKIEQNENNLINKMTDEYSLSSNNNPSFIFNFYNNLLSIAFNF